MNSNSGVSSGSTGTGTGSRNLIFQWIDLYGTRRGMGYAIQPNSTWTFGRTGGGDHGNHITATGQHNIAPQHAIIERFGDRQTVRISSPPFPFVTNIIRANTVAGQNIYIATTMNIGDRVQFGSDFDDIFELARGGDGHRWVPPARLMLRPKPKHEQQQQEQNTDTTSPQPQQKEDNHNDAGSRNLLFRWIHFDGSSRGKEFGLQPNRTLTFGRYRANDIPTQALDIALVHSRIVRIGDSRRVRISPPPRVGNYTTRIYRNGTGRPVINDPMEMAIGERVQFGSTLEDIFELVEDSDDDDDDDGDGIHGTVEAPPPSQQGQVSQPHQSHTSSVKSNQPIWVRQQNLNSTSQSDPPGNNHKSSSSDLVFSRTQRNVSVDDEVQFDDDQSNRFRIVRIDESGIGAVAVAAPNETQESLPPCLKLLIDCWEEIPDYLSVKDIHSFGETCKILIVLLK